MPSSDPAVQRLFASLDRFVQWDLVTVSPWGAPSISPVGARLVAEEACVWTSTTVGYAAKVRNIRAHPRVALMRTHPEEPAILVRGEARVVAGDGTLNLAQLFRLMGGAGGARPFFATSATDPGWSRLYRSYWRRFLIAVRIVDVSRLGKAGWEPFKVSRWSGASGLDVERPGPRPRPRRRGELLDRRGRALLEAGVPAALATVRRPGACPVIWPVRASPLSGGGLGVAPPAGLPHERLPRSSLAVRVIDDNFEVAQMAGWIGTLQPGKLDRLFSPRATYGFIKPPGVFGDLGAGIAALVRGSGLPASVGVSSPDLATALELGGAQSAPRLDLPAPAWNLLVQVFARRNAAAPWYAAMAAVVPERSMQARLKALAERAQLERDWAHGLLTRGERRVGVRRLAAGALAFRPNPAAVAATARREEAELERLLSRLTPLLSERGAPPPGRGVARSGMGTRRSQEGGLADATLAAATSVAAALDRWQERRSR
ncbi:MAG TPA: pyridoxamine 5'-phosphate oxidase family protein [Candidatus Dormibacteraeota bacterium]